LVCLGQIEEGWGFLNCEREREFLNTRKEVGDSFSGVFLKRGIERERFNEKIEKGSFQFLKVKFLNKNKILKKKKNLNKN